MKLRQFLNLFTYLLLVAATGALWYTQNQILFWIIFAVTLFFLIGTSGSLFAAKAKTFNDMRKLRLKKSVISGYLQGDHLPAIVDGAFYSVILGLLVTGDMIFISVLWLAIAYCDLKSRQISYSMESQAFICAYDKIVALIEKLKQEGKL